MEQSFALVLMVRELGECVGFYLFNKKNKNNKQNLEGWASKIGATRGNNWAGPYEFCAILPKWSLTRSLEGPTQTKPNLKPTPSHKSSSLGF